MPNALAHLGINGLATKPIIRTADLKWIYLGAIIPDIAWIIQRVVKFIYPSVNGYDLRLYVIIQASLLFSLILSFWFSSFSKNQLRTFIILSLGSLLHLLLDACQVKWGNGVLLFAPFSWKLLDFGFFWPESWATYLITLFSLGYVIFYWKSVVNEAPDLKFRSVKYHSIYLLVLLSYFILPPTMLQSPQNADNHFVKTLREYHNRSGKHIEFDRRTVFSKNGNLYVKTFANENIKIIGKNLPSSGTVSIKGMFIDNTTIQVTQFHVHSVLFRDGASYLGLFIILIIWVMSFIKTIKRANKKIMTLTEN
ncbi:hypothetical protein BMS3Abin04_00441 [bacterium BMS3Abin04]|nr:hypothetical protein BMS3Abin04_00441 [bacterium BMS3Abin04]